MSLTERLNKRTGNTLGTNPKEGTATKELQSGGDWHVHGPPPRYPAPLHGHEGKNPWPHALPYPMHYTHGKSRAMELFTTPEFPHPLERDIVMRRLKPCFTAAWRFKRIKTYHTIDHRVFHDQELVGKITAGFASFWPGPLSLSIS